MVWLDTAAIFHQCAMAHWCAARILKTCNTYLVRVTDLFSLRLSNKNNLTTATKTIAVWCESIKIITFLVGDALFLEVLQYQVGARGVDGASSYSISQFQKTHLI